MAYNNVPTIYGSAVQTCKNLTLPLTIEPFTTLNEVLSNNTAVPNQNPGGIATLGMQLPTPYNQATDQNGVAFQYLAIGNGGHRFINGATPGSVPYSSPIPHAATDAGLYHMIPWICVPVSNDLDATTRQNYRLRQTVTIGGVLYAVYYLRVIGFGSTVPIMNITTVVDGVSSTEVFEPSISNLIPSQPALGATNNGEIASIDTTVSITLSATDVQNIQNACQLMFGDVNQAIISELAICSGVDKPIVNQYPTSGTQTPTPIVGSSIKEAVIAQCGCFVSTYRQLSVDNGGVTISFDIGVSEPLFGDVAGS